MKKLLLSFVTMTLAVSSAHAGRAAPTKVEDIIVGNSLTVVSKSGVNDCISTTSWRIKSNAPYAKELIAMLTHAQHIHANVIIQGTGSCAADGAEFIKFIRFPGIDILKQQ